MDAIFHDVSIYLAGAIFAAGAAAGMLWALILYLIDRRRKK